MTWMALLEHKEYYRTESVSKIASDQYEQLWLPLFEEGKLKSFIDLQVPWRGCDCCNHGIDLMASKSTSFLVQNYLQVIYQSCN